MKLKDDWAEKIKKVMFKLWFWVVKKIISKILHLFYLPKNPMRSQRRGLILSSPKRKTKM